MRTAIRLELRHSPPHWWIPFLPAIEVAVLFGRNHDWIGIWPEASVAAQIAVGFQAHLLAAAATWDAGRTTRSGSAEELLPSVAQARWRVELAHVVGTLVYGLVRLLVEFVIAAVASVGVAGVGFIWPGTSSDSADSTRSCIHRTSSTNAASPDEHHSDGMMLRYGLDEAAWSLAGIAVGDCPIPGRRIRDDLGARPTPNCPRGARRGSAALRPPTPNRSRE